MLHLNKGISSRLVHESVNNTQINVLLAENVFTELTYGCSDCSVRKYQYFHLCIPDTIHSQNIEKDLMAKLQWRI